MKDAKFNFIITEFMRKYVFRCEANGGSTKVSLLGDGKGVENNFKIKRKTEYY